MRIGRCSRDIIYNRNVLGLDVSRVKESRHGLWRYQAYLRRNRPTAEDFGITMREAFAVAEKQVPSIIVHRDLLGGIPCIKGTRIPVYMILDGIEYHGNLKGVLKSYPQLSLEQVKDAVRFSKILTECDYSS
jgi:uncharacterized protein (DUF433 family)